MQGSRRFGRFSALVLLVTVAVIVWGAFVRASRSGAGCGSHWPLCNGEVIPRAKSVATVIEATHRATSGIVLVLIVVQFLWALRAFPPRSPVRKAATAGLALISTEALVGAGLVLFEMVAGNASTARAAWMAVHLMNTFALLAALGLTVWFAHRPAGEVIAPSLLRAFRPALVAALAAIAATAITGAVAALGDTLFPARSLAEGLAQDFSPSAHLFLRLRFAHPALAIASAAYLLTLASLLASRDPSGRIRPFATTAAALVLVQLTIGVLNIVLLAPTALQLLHLLSADTVWLAFVFLTAAAWPAARRSAETPALA